MTLFLKTVLFLKAVFLLSRWIVTVFFSLCALSLPALIVAYDFKSENNSIIALIIFICAGNCVSLFYMERIKVNSDLFAKYSFSKLSAGELYSCATTVIGIIVISVSHVIGYFTLKGKYLPGLATFWTGFAILTAGVLLVCVFYEVYKIESYRVVAESQPEVQMHTPNNSEPKEAPPSYSEVYP